MRSFWLVIQFVLGDVLAIYLITPKRPTPEESSRAFAEITAQRMVEYGQESRQAEGDLQTTQ